jgi:hypothetical protein
MPRGQIGQPGYRRKEKLMKLLGKKVRSIFVASAVSTLMAVMALPASAADGDTTATVTITGGSLSITVPGAAAHLGTRANTVAAGTISGSLGEVQVLDARSAAAGSGWVASAISTAFTGQTPALAATGISYSAGSIAKVGTAAYTANNPSSLVGVAPVVTASGITGDNSATWNPTITVAVPGGSVAGTYTAVITHSVL